MTVSRPSYICNGNKEAWKDGLYIERGPWFHRLGCLLSSSSNIIHPPIYTRVVIIHALLWFGRVTHILHCSLQLRHNERGGVSNHRRLHCLLNYCFRRTSRKTPKLRVTGLCVGNSLVTGEFFAQKASNAENVSIWRCHYDFIDTGVMKW